MIIIIVGCAVSLRYSWAHIARKQVLARESQGAFLYGRDLAWRFVHFLYIYLCKIRFLSVLRGKVSTESTAVKMVTQTELN